MIYIYICSYIYIVLFIYVYSFIYIYYSHIEACLRPMQLTSHFSLVKSQRDRQVDPSHENHQGWENAKAGSKTPSKALKMHGDILGIWGSLGYTRIWIRIYIYIRISMIFWGSVTERDCSSHGHLSRETLSDSPVDGHRGLKSKKLWMYPLEALLTLWKTNITMENHNF